MTKDRLNFILVALALLSLLVACTTPTEVPTTAAEPTATSEPPTPTDALILATTTSTDDSGLLAYLLPSFEEEYGLQVDVVAMGTGQAACL